MEPRYMPSDPDRWDDLEAMGESARDTIAQKMKEVCERCDDMISLLETNQEYAETVGGLAVACLAGVITAFRTAARTGDPDGLSRIFDQVVELADEWEESHGGEAS